MSKIFILDTNVLLHDPDSLFVFEDNEVVIPMIVLDELDKKKVGTDEVARSARQVIRSLDELRLQGSILSGIQTKGGGIIRAEISKAILPPDLDPNRPDNKILAVALGIIKSCPDRKVIVVSKDINLRVKCDALGITVEDYDNDRVAERADEVYNGLESVILDEQDIINFNNDLPLVLNKDLYPNQYIWAKTADGNKKNSVLMRFIGKGLPMAKLQIPQVIWGISARNREQACALDALLNPDIKLVTLIGAPGSGKTLLSVAAAVSQLLDSHIYKKISMMRPIQPLGRDLGYLPGDVSDKLIPWLAPIQDNLELIFSAKGISFLNQLKDDGKLEMQAITYIRGRSIPNTLLIVDESQQLTKHEVKTILTRVGENSKIVMTGDIKQIDNPYLDSTSNGLTYAVEMFKQYPISAHVTLTKGERSELATLAADIM